MGRATRACPSRGSTSATTTERLTQLVGSGEPPDFIKLDQGDVAEFVAAGLLEPVSDVVSELGTVPESLRLFQDGEDWIIPSETGYWMQFYRADVYDQLGLQPGVSWDAFRSNLDALEASELSPNLFVTNPASGYLTDVVVNNLWSNDVPIWDFQDGKWVVTLNSDEFRDRVVETLEFMKSRAARSPESGNYSYSEVNQTYASGTVATIEYQGRTLKYLTENAPDLLDITGVAQQTHNAELRSTAATAGFAIFKKDGRSDAIKEMLLEFLRGDSYLDYLWTVPGHLIPTTKEGLNGEWRQNEFLRRHLRERRDRDDPGTHDVRERPSRLSERHDPAPCSWVPARRARLERTHGLDRREPRARPGHDRDLELRRRRGERAAMAGGGGRPARVSTLSRRADPGLRRGDQGGSQPDGHRTGCAGRAADRRGDLPLSSSWSPRRASDERAGSVGSRRAHGASRLDVPPARRTGIPGRRNRCVYISIT